jgi:hypothetical protein
VLPDMVADDRQVSQSGKPLCTGSSLWAVPKLARGRCPLEPRQERCPLHPQPLISFSPVPKCPPDILKQRELIS